MKAVNHSGSLRNNHNQEEFQIAKWYLHKPMYLGFYHCNNKREIVACIARRWKVGGVMLHYNRGCEGMALGVAEKLSGKSLPARRRRSSF